jgi:hypothetical protein
MGEEERLKLKPDLRTSLSKKRAVSKNGARTRLFHVVEDQQVVAVFASWQQGLELFA